MNKLIKIEKILQEGYQLFKNQNFNESIKKFKKALIFDSEYSKTLYLLGLSYGSINKPNNAIKYFSRSLLNDPNNFYIHYNLAKALSELNLDKKSLIHHKKALALESSNFNAWLNYGISQKKLKNFNSAIDCFKKCISLNSTDSKPLSNLGEILIELNDFNGAKNCFEQSLLINPNSADDMTNLGIAYKNMNDYKKSIKYHLEAIKINNNHSAAYSNLGITYRRVFKNKKALTYLNKAIEINADLESAWINKGLILADMNKYEESKFCYEKVIKLNKNNAEVCLNLSLLELANQKYINGWKYYEKRWQTKNFQKYITTKKKQWDGITKHKSILIVSEQGLGDQILYASMFNELKKFSKKIHLLCDPKLFSLFTRSFANFNVISRSNFNNEKPLQNFDMHIPMGSLGKYFRKGLRDFKNSMPPYIFDNEHLTKKLKKQIKENKKLICGITWHSKNDDFGVNKSINLDILSPILENKKIKIINLQYGNVSELINKYNYNHDNKIISVPEINLTEDIDGSISVIKNCDFVITISNTTAHLAGSIDKDVLLLTPKNIGKLHYWSSNSDRSLWYPSIKIFKQEENYSWSKTINKVNNYIKDNYILK